MSKKLGKASVADLRSALMKNIEVMNGVRGQYALDPRLAAAWDDIQTFCGISLRVMAKTNYSKLRDEMRTAEIAARIAGRPVVSD